MNTLPSPRALVLRAVALVLMLTLSAAAAESEKTYEAQLSDARRFAGEKSWALARDAYAAAVKLAPDAEAKRWCELWLAQAEWRGVENDNNHWQATRDLERRLDEWQAPYQSNSLESQRRGSPRPKDDFWAEVMSLRIEIAGSRNQLWDLRTELLEYFASAAPSKKAKERLLEFARGIDYAIVPYGGDEDARSRFGEILGRIAKNGMLAPDDSAWCFLISYGLGKPDAQARLWQDMAVLCKGTSLEPVSDAMIFAGEVASDGASDISSGAESNRAAWRGGYAGLLARARELRAKLPVESKDFLVGNAAKALDSLIGEWRWPHLRGNMPSSIGTADCVEFSVGAARVRNVRAELYSYDLAAFRALAELGDDSGKLHDLALLERQRQVPGVRLVASMPLFPNPPENEFAWQSGVFRFDLPQPLAPGFYMIALVGEGSFADADGHVETLARMSHFVVSDFRALVMNARDAGLADVYVLGKNDGVPVVDAETSVAWFVESWRRARNDGVAQVGQTWSGKTDASGRARLSLPEKNIDYATIVANGHPVVASSLRIYAASPRYWENEDFAADLFLDRPLYRPGETVHWKLIARERLKDGRFAPCAQPGQLSVSLDNTELVKNSPLSFNAFGTAHGEFVIPASARPGEARWSLKLGQKDVYLYDSFRVDNFVPPAASATIELVSPVESVRPGQEIAFRFNARYYSGGGIAGAPVECAIFADFERSQRDAAAQAAYREAEKWKDDLEKRPLQGVTNANGDAEFRLKLPGLLPGRTTVVIRATAKPPGMADMRAQTGVCVNEAGAFANPKADEFPMLVEPRAENVFSFDVVNAAGKPCAFEGKVVFSERRWLEIWLDRNGREVRGIELAEAKKEEAARRGVNPASRYYDYDYYDNASEPRSPLPEGWTRVFADYVRAPVAGQNVACGADGRLEIKFTPPHEGIFDVSVEKDGKALAPMKHTRWAGGEEKPTDDMSAGRWIFVAADRQTKSLAFKPEDAFILGLGKNSGEKPPQVLLVLPEGCPGVYLSVASSRQVLAQRFMQSSRAGFVVFDDALNLSAASEQIEAKAFDFTNDWDIARATTFIDNAKAKLSLDIVPEKTEQQPGDSAGVNIVARNNSGSPVRAELAVAVADNAVIEMGNARYPGLRDPMFFRRVYARGVDWSSSGFRQSARAIGLIADLRSGAVGLARRAGRIEDAKFLEREKKKEQEGIVATDSFGAAYMAAPPVPSEASSRSVLGQVFDLTDLDVRPANSGGIRLRRHFAWTAFWEPEVVTGADGSARVSFVYPDNLTQWRVAAYAVGEDGNSFGVAQALTRTSLPLQARVLAPRFLIEGDSVALTGLLVNRTDAELAVTAEMSGTGAVELAGDVAQAAEPARSTSANPMPPAPPANPPHENKNKNPRAVTTPKQGEARASWQARAREPGEGVVTLAAKASNVASAADAMRATLPVLEDGIRQDTAACARINAGDASVSLTLPLPNPLNRERLAAEVIIAQGRAGVLLDAMPFLIDYPYGCVEQTMSRFLPAVVVKKTLADFGFEAEAVEKRVMQTARSNLVAPGFAKLDDVVAQSLSRLREAQRHGEGFGWWPGSGETDLWMTAYVAWGLQLAREAGVAVSDDWLKQVRDTVRRKCVEAKVVDDRLAWALFVMGEMPAGSLDKNSVAELGKVYAQVYAGREKLSASGRACLLASAARWGADAERAVLLRNLENGAQRTAHGVHWGATGGYWRATEGAVESTALTVLALLKTAPDSPLAQPALDWLVMNRRGTGWQNTRASAFALLALARSLPQAGAGALTGGAEVFLNGKKLGVVTFSKEALLAGATRVALPADLLQGGDNRIELKRGTGGVSGTGSLPVGSGSGTGCQPVGLTHTDTGWQPVPLAPIYATALASAWARGDAVKPAGNMASVARDFSGRRVEPTLGGDGVLRETALTTTGVARTGDEVTARVRLSAPGELEYVMVEAPKPAGCEPLNPLSGWDAELVRVDSAKSGGENTRRVYREEHDDRSAFFLDHIEAGEWEIRFKMRAITPGNFRALPVKVEAMYAPEIRANSDARRVTIEP